MQSKYFWKQPLYKVSGLSVFHIPPLRDACVPNYVVQANVAARLHPFSCKKEGHARHALHSVPTLVQDEAIRTEATLVAEQEAKSCGQTRQKKKTHWFRKGRWGRGEIQG